MELFLDIPVQAIKVSASHKYQRLALLLNYFILILFASFFYFIYLYLLLHLNFLYSDLIVTAIIGFIDLVAVIALFSPPSSDLNLSFVCMIKICTNGKHLR